MKKTIAIDFDGVIHSYHKKWHDGSIYGYPIEGVKEILTRLQLYYKIIIYSTRVDSKVVEGKYQSGQLKEMHDWLVEHEIPFDSIHHGTGKPLCVLFIDDNALRFEGDWKRTAQQLENLNYL